MQEEELEGVREQQGLRLRLSKTRSSRQIHMGCHSTSMATHCRATRICMGQRTRGRGTGSARAGAFTRHAFCGCCDANVLPTLECTGDGCFWSGYGVLYTYVCAHSGGTQGAFYGTGSAVRLCERTLNRTTKRTTRLAKCEARNPARRYFGSHLELNSKYTQLAEAVSHDTMDLSELLVQSGRHTTRPNARGTKPDIAPKRLPAVGTGTARYSAGRSHTMCFVHLMKSKAQVPEAIDAFYYQVGILTRLHSDSCKEAQTPGVRAKAKAVGVRLTATEPYTSRQNPAEGYIGTMQNMVKRPFDTIDRAIPSTARSPMCQLSTFNFASRLDKKKRWGYQLI